MKIILLTLSLVRNLVFNSPVQSQEISLEPYCKDGYYQIQGEQKCSRAPGCGGYTYDQLNTSSYMPDANACMGQGSSGRAQKGCAGYVPLCCYEVARTGDFTKCIGYWERLWCTKSQCDTARSKGASDSQCGGDCQCSHAFNSYCGAKDPVPLSQRLSGTTPKPTSANPTPTATTNNSTPTPGTCTISKSKLSVFVLDNLTSGAQTIMNAGPPVIKFLDPQLDQKKLDAIKKYKESYPGGSVVARFFHTQGSLAACETGYMRSDCVSDDPDQYAQIYFDKVESPALKDMKDYIKYVDYVTGPNEFEDLPYPWEVQGEANTQERAISREKWNAKFWLKFTQLIHDNYGIKTCILSIPSGNMGSKEFSNMLPELDKIAQLGGTICYHQYQGLGDGHYKNILNYLSSVKSQYPNLSSMKMIMGEGGGKNWQNDSGPYKSYLQSFDNDIQSNSRIIGITLFQIGNGSTWARSDHESIANWIADQLKSGQTTTSCNNGTGNPTATPLPSGICSAASAPSLISPVGGGVYPGKVTIQWKKTTGAKNYALRIDDMSNPWNSDCTNSNSGDMCVNDISGTSYTFTAVEGHTYHYWVHSINYCGEWSHAADTGVTAPPITDANTCRIQGYRTLIGPLSPDITQWGYSVRPNNQNNSLTIWSPDSIKSLPISVEGDTPVKTFQYNPFHVLVPANKTYTATVQNISGYTVSSTLCVNRIDCHDLNNPQGSLQQGNTRTFTCPANQFIDLWFNFTPSSIPTLTPGPNQTNDTPTPTYSLGSCTTPSDLSWAANIARERIDSTTDKVTLKWNKGAETFVKIDYSTDNQQTWTTTLAGDQEYFDSSYSFDVVGVSEKPIDVRIQIKNRCGQAGNYLYGHVDIAPTGSQTTPTISTIVSQPVSKVVLIGGTLLVALLVTAFFIGA